MNDSQKMFGVSDINQFVESVKESITYKLSGGYMVVAGLMSDAQEELTYGMTEPARKTLNRAKHLLFLIADGELVGAVERAEA
jgi:hypothetical protein|tara:strand:- start:6938 stop:7186 length:249 start_codon:yes stop_codon:yes gene_type:complete